jgi:hypothetical protein
MLGAIRPLPAVIPQRNNSDSFSADSPPRYNPDLEIVPANNPTGRADNQGVEGLTASPDGKTLYALLQSALDQDGGLGTSTRRYARLLEYDVSDVSKPAYKAEYVVPLPRYSNDTRIAAQSELHYLSPTQFLVLARDSSRGHGQDNSNSLYRHVDVFDISSATDIKGDTYDCTTCSVAPYGTLKASVTPATYCSWLDFNVTRSSTVSDYTMGVLRIPVFSMRSGRALLSSQLILNLGANGRIGMSRAMEKTSSLA